ncbi:hypothetical protein ACQ4M3_20455 [Leptolyngbya sp. AN03gr2]|uniref:hypothetical protein n=1 Tax=unclassified Leptolyngbya TaxID=2650499 RepID=UPI003D31D1D0
MSLHPAEFEIVAQHNIAYLWRPITPQPYFPTVAADGQDGIYRVRYNGLQQTCQYRSNGDTDTITLACPFGKPGSCWWLTDRHLVELAKIDVVRLHDAEFSDKLCSLKLLEEGPLFQDYVQPPKSCTTTLEDSIETIVDCSFQNLWQMLHPEIDYKQNPWVWKLHLYQKSKDGLLQQ